METKHIPHTPGPWDLEMEVRKDRLHYFGIWDRPFSRHIADIYCPRSEDEMLANARLIAAAPDLLRALENFTEQAAKVSGHPAAYAPYTGALVMARAAIRRAREGDI